jgi:DNA-binding transcriptional LysR family regulator
MIENYLLEGLVAFAKCGTLAKAAEKLSVTQPALTRSMKKIEQELDVELFDRQPNKITLTETGQFAAQEAQKLLWTNQAYGIKVKNFAKSHMKINIAANAPGPLIVARAINTKNFLIHPTFITGHFSELLNDGQFSILMLNQPLKAANITSIYLGTERLAINVPKDSPIVQSKKLYFKNLSGTTFLVAKNVGFWGQLFEQEIPNAKFIYQGNSEEYSELLNHSNFPYFSTNLTALDKLWGTGLPKDRLTVFFTDKIAQQKFYACFLTKNKSRLTPLIKKLQDEWASFD